MEHYRDNPATVWHMEYCSDIHGSSNPCLRGDTSECVLPLIADALERVLLERLDHECDDDTPEYLHPSPLPDWVNVVT